MAQVEDMAGTLFRSPQYVAHPLFDGFPGSKQQRRVEVALDAALIANARPGIIQVYAPIHADDVAASRGHQLEQAGRAGAEVDGGGARRFHSFKYALSIGQDESDRKST